MSSYYQHYKRRDGGLIDKIFCIDEGMHYSYKRESDGREYSEAGFERYYDTGLKLPVVEEVLNLKQFLNISKLLGWDINFDQEDQYDYKDMCIYVLLDRLRENKQKLIHELADTNNLIQNIGKKVKK